MAWPAARGTWTLVKVGTLPRSGSCGRPLGKAISGTIRWEGIFNYFQHALTKFSLCAMYLEGIGNTKINKTPPAPEEP